MGRKSDRIGRKEGRNEWTNERTNKQTKEGGKEGREGGREGGRKALIPSKGFSPTDCSKKTKAYSKGRVQYCLPTPHRKRNGESTVCACCSSNTKLLFTVASRRTMEALLQTMRLWLRMLLPVPPQCPLLGSTVTYLLIHTHVLVRDQPPCHRSCVKRSLHKMP